MQQETSTTKSSSTERITGHLQSRSSQPTFNLLAGAKHPAAFSTKHLTWPILTKLNTTTLNNNKNLNNHTRKPKSRYNYKTADVYETLLVLFGSHAVMYEDGFILQIMPYWCRQVTVKKPVSSHSPWLMCKKTITADAEIGFLKKLTYLNYWNTLAVCHAKAIKPKLQIANTDNSLMSLNKTLFLRRPRGPMTSLKMCLPTWASTALSGSSSK